MMAFQADPNCIVWRLHLTSPPEEVYRILSTEEGCARFWAEKADERDESIFFRFPNGLEYRGRIVESSRPATFAVEYFGSIATFRLSGDENRGTDLTLTNEGVPQEDRAETAAGWVSVLMALKAAVDFGVDLRNHDPMRTWDQGYADN
jgi:uncharacterized protein YndB with AHSA1/START domain